MSFALLRKRVPAKQKKPVSQRLVTPQPQPASGNHQPATTTVPDESTKQPKESEQHEELEDAVESSELPQPSNPAPTTTLSWVDVGVEPWLERHLHRLNMTIPTLIQEKCIPPTASGKNVIGMAQTGTGKTAAFALPIIQSLAKDVFGIFALIISPTRELAQQIKMHFEILAGDLPIRIALVTGGQSLLQMAQVMDSKPHIVVGTPAMVESCVRSFNGDFFKKIKFLVFDEADQLLQAEYALDVDLILQSCNPKRQTLLYSATMDKHVKRLAQMALKKDPSNVFIYDACKLYTTAENLNQYYCFVPETVKDCYLYDMLKRAQESPKKIISMVFFSTLETCEVTMRTCRMMGIKCASLHSAMRQKERFDVLNEFKNRRINSLFCTDVANRGLDIPSVNYVINYDLPSHTYTYVHRVGRTARAGQSGISVSLVSQYDVKRIQAVERDIGKEMELYSEITEEAEKHMYALAEKRCEAKIQLIDSGFIDRYAKVKENRQKSKRMQAQGRISFERKELLRLKEEFGKRASAVSQQVSSPPVTGQGEEETTTREQQLPTGSVYVGDVTLLKRKVNVANDKRNKKQKTS